MINLELSFNYFSFRFERSNRYLSKVGNWKEIDVLSNVVTVVKLLQIFIHLSICIYKWLSYI